MTTTDNLITDLWWFIENVTDDTPDRTERFFDLRDRYRDYWQEKREKDTRP